MQEVSPENFAALESCYRRTAIIVAAQIIFTIILTAAVWLLAPRAAENAISQQTLWTLWTAIVFLAVGAFVLRRAFYRWDRLRDITTLKGIGGLLATLQNNAIILAVFATLLTVVGCAVAVLTGERFEAFRAQIVALIVFLVNFPRKFVWKKIVAAMEKV